MFLIFCQGSCYRRQIRHFPRKIGGLGVPYNDGNGSNSGHVRVYQYSGSSWSKLGDDIDGEANLDQSGWSVSLSSDGTTVAIGANVI